MVELAAKGAEEHLSWISPYDMKRGGDETDGLQKATPRAILATFKRIAERHRQQAQLRASQNTDHAKAVAAARQRRRALEANGDARSEP